MTMKFDCILGNPPFQSMGKVGKKTHPIWDKFVHKNIELLKTNGHLALIHPAGWRNPSGRFVGAQDIITGNTLKYLSIHGLKDGMKTFRANTRYDWYVLQKEVYNNTQFTVRYEDGELLTHTVSDFVIHS
jgi:hypothetical protein